MIGRCKIIRNKEKQKMKQRKYNLVQNKTIAEEVKQENEGVQNILAFFTSLPLV